MEIGVCLQIVFVCVCVCMVCILLGVMSESESSVEFVSVLGLVKIGVYLIIVCMCMYGFCSAVLLCESEAGLSVLGADGDQSVPPDCVFVLLGDV